MEKNLNFYKKVAKEFRQMVKGCTKETDVKVVASETGIDILPAKTNTMRVFYHTEELVDFCRYKRLNNWIDVYDGFPRVRIY